MKKRLLITSIVMMLVVAVALSTATYAWFTSNANVTASSISLKADTSEATALGIGWAGGNAGTSISANVFGTLAPMAPVALTSTTTAGGGTSDISFFTQTTKNLDSVYVFNEAGTAATPITYANGSGQGSANAFYVTNLSPENTIGSITVSAIFGANDVNVETKAYTYAPITTKTIAAAATYYTAAGNVYTAHTVGNEAIANTNYVAATGTYVAGTKYYDLSGETPAEVDTSEFEVGVTSVTAYHTFTATNFAQSETSTDSKTADDMIRVAIFRKDYGAGAYTTGDYKLIGVLGQTATAYTKVTSGSWDRNTTYYVKSGDVYTQTAITAEQFANYIAATWDDPSDQTDDLVENPAYGTLYTAANTAVFGTISKDGAVKDLQNYEVKTSLELVESGKDLGTKKQIDLMAIVWLDGTVFTDSRANDIGSVSLKFHA